MKKLIETAKNATKLLKIPNMRQMFFGYFQYVIGLVLMWYSLLNMNDILLIPIVGFGLISLIWGFYNIRTSKSKQQTLFTITYLALKTKEELSDEEKEYYKALLKYDYIQLIEKNIEKK